MSPSIILKASLAAAAADSSSPEATPIDANVEQEQQRFFSSFDLTGEAIPHRAGLAHAESLLMGVKPAAPTLPLSALRGLPPTFVMSSCADHMVSFESDNATRERAPPPLARIRLSRPGPMARGRGAGFAPAKMRRAGTPPHLQSRHAFRLRHVMEACPEHQITQRERWRRSRVAGPQRLCSRPPEDPEATRSRGGSFTAGAASSGGPAA